MYRIGVTQGLRVIAASTLERCYRGWQGASVSRSGAFGFYLNQDRSYAVGEYALALTLFQRERE